MLIASGVLIAGILVAGCTDSSSGQASGTANPATTEVQPAAIAGSENSNIPAISGTPESGAGTGDIPVYNQSAVQGTPPAGLQPNGTRPSGAPPDGMQMNGTRPSGTPPSGTSPSGSPPSQP